MLSWMLRAVLLRLPFWRASHEGVRERPVVGTVLLRFYHYQVPGAALGVAGDRLFVFVFLLSCRNVGVAT